MGKKNVKLVGLDNQNNDLFGPFGNDHLTGGNDTSLTSLPIMTNSLVGDAQDLSGSAGGGNDTLIGGELAGRRVRFIMTGVPRAEGFGRRWVDQRAAVDPT